MKLKKFLKEKKITRREVENNEDFFMKDMDTHKHLRVFQSALVLTSFMS